ncbi:MAG: NAD kinase [Bacteroidetes bacterium GWF2_43_63]|nr:MAG: NAD kinase [Bacteroidetes bacterium GWE2_42_42]OFY53167.1 MAG: NAD kinase [Bacteroidetes bacterium GWF2_43_63]HBG70318.1 NAD kinase [Bacteroidales bacterium]HCB60635.1 NAD kinase [Bacteroidales bacterium]HCY23004.1 NAD kinase [Bacteroidales bacterium]
MRICVFLRNYSSDFNNEIQTVLDVVSQTNGQAIFCGHMQAQISAAFSLPSNTKFLKQDESVAGVADLVVSLGGDGTILETVNLIRDSGIPVMGVHFGRLGFLSNVRKEDFRLALDEFRKGNYTLSGRTVLEIDDCEQFFGKKIYALNEVSVHKSNASSMIAINTWVNGDFMNSYWSDGIILATPTGSTAYSLSCGGPILVPEAENFILTPIAPHNLSVRPIVISDKDVITFIPEGRTDTFILSLDSNQTVLNRGQKVSIRKAPFTINFVRLPADSFFCVIREKLMWGEDKRNK